MDYFNFISSSPCRLLISTSSGAPSPHDEQYRSFLNNIRRIVHEFITGHNPNAGEYIGDPNYIESLRNAIKSFEDLSRKIDLYLLKESAYILPPDAQRFYHIKNIMLTEANKMRLHLTNISTSQRPRMVEVRNAIENAKKKIVMKFNPHDLKKIFNSLFLEFGSSHGTNDRRTYEELEQLFLSKKEEFLAQIVPMLQEIEDHVLLVQENRATYKTIDKNFVRNRLETIRDLFNSNIIHSPEIEERAKKISGDIKRAKDKYLSSLMDTTTGIPKIDIKARQPLLNLIRTTHFRKSEADKFLAERLRNFDAVLQKSIAPRGPAKVFGNSPESKEERKTKIKVYKTNNFYEVGQWREVYQLISKDMKDGMPFGDSFAIHTSGWDTPEKRAFHKFLSYYRPRQHKKLMGDVAIELNESDMVEVVQFLNSATKDNNGYVIYNYKLLGLHQNLIADQSGKETSKKIVDYIMTHYGDRVPSQSSENPVPYHFGGHDANTVVAVIERSLFEDLAAMSFQITHAGAPPQTTANPREKQFVRDTIIGKFWGWVPTTPLAYDQFQQRLTKAEHETISNFLVDFNEQINQSFEDALAEHIISIDAVIYNIENAIKRVSEEKHIAPGKSLHQQRMHIYKDMSRFVDDIEDVKGRPVYNLPKDDEESTQSALIDYDTFLKHSYFNYIDRLKPDISSQLDNEDILKRWLYNFKFMANLNVFKAIAYQIESKVIGTMRLRHAQLNKVFKIFRNNINKYDKQSSAYRNLDFILQAMDLQISVAIVSMRVILQKLVSAKAIADYPDTATKKFKNKIKKSIMNFFSVIASDNSETLYRYGSDEMIKCSITSQQCDYGLRELRSYIDDVRRAKHEVQKIVQDNEPYLSRLENSKDPSHRAAIAFVRSFIGNPDISQSKISLRPSDIFSSLYTAEVMLEKSYKHIEGLCYALVPGAEFPEQRLDEIARQIRRDPTHQLIETEKQEEIPESPTSYLDDLKEHLSELSKNLTDSNLDSMIENFLQTMAGKDSKQIQEHIPSLYREMNQYLEGLYNRDKNEATRDKMEFLKNFFASLEN